MSSGSGSPEDSNGLNNSRPTPNASTEGLDTTQDSGPNGVDPLSPLEDEDFDLTNELGTSQNEECQDGADTASANDGPETKPRTESSDEPQSLDLDEGRPSSADSSSGDQELQGASAAMSDLAAKDHNMKVVKDYLDLNFEKMRREASSENNKTKEELVAASLNSLDRMASLTEEQKQTDNKATQAQVAADQADKRSLDNKKKIDCNTNATTENRQAVKETDKKATQAQVTADQADKRSLKNKKKIDYNTNAAIGNREAASAASNKADQAQRTADQAQGTAEGAVGGVEALVSIRNDDMKGTAKQLDKLDQHVGKVMETQTDTTEMIQQGRQAHEEIDDYYGRRTEDLYGMFRNLMATVEHLSQRVADGDESVRTRNLELERLNHSVADLRSRNVELEEQLSRLTLAEPNGGDNRRDSGDGDAASSSTNLLEEQSGDGNEKKKSDDAE